MLELKNITKQFGSVTANDRVNIQVAAGTIHAIVGENGAGKSTAMRIAYGFYTADAGEILINGKPQTIHSPGDAIQLGIGMVHQHFTLVDTMTVTENIILGAEGGSPMALNLDEAEQRVRRLSDSFGLAVDPRATIESLSVGQQQRVELLKALYREARILILDEPTAVLTPQEIEGLFRILRTMRDGGKTVVIITHKLSEVLAISDEVTVMRDGKVVGGVRTAETTAAELARLMVGRDVLLRVDKPDAKPAEVVLSVKNLSSTARGTGVPLKNVSFDVRRGEIIGIAGVEGNGQTELVEALAGLAPGGSLSGSVSLSGSDVTSLGVRKRREAGIGHIPEDRHRRGLLLDFDLRENAILGIHHRKPASAGMLLDNNAIAEWTSKLIEAFDVRPPNPDLAARSLSGGNQQKLIIGREFGVNPKVLLVAQPTRGVDIGAIEFIHRKLVELRDSGCAVLLVSSELEEVTALADRLLIMHAGEIAGEVDPQKATLEEIGLLMTGGKVDSR